MVTMLPSYWHSVTVLALVVIVSNNISLVTSYCSDQSDFRFADNRLDRIESEIVLKGRQERGNELDRTFRDSLRRNVNDIDRIRRSDTNRFDRRKSENSLNRNIRLSREDQRRIESDEQNNRAGILTRRLDHNQNRNNLRRTEIRNEVAKKSSDVLREELIRQERAREGLVRKLDDREGRYLDQRVNNQRIRDERVHELRMSRESVRKEPVSNERIREERLSEQRVREERVRVELVRVEQLSDEQIRKEPVREERASEERVREEQVREERVQVERVLMEQVRKEPVLEKRAREEQVRVREERVREERVREGRVREERVLMERVRMEQVRKESVRGKRIRKERVREERAREMLSVERQEPIGVAHDQQVMDFKNRKERFGEERIRDTNVRYELIHNERMVDITLNRKEFARRQLSGQSHNTRNNEMNGRLNVITRRERMSDPKDSRRLREENSQRSMDDRRGNRRTEVISENQNEQRHQELLDDTAERQMSDENRRELENRLSINQHIENREDSRRIESRRDTSSRRDIVNHSHERGNRYNDKLSAYHSDYRSDVPFKEFIHNSPQLSWNLCQTVLLGVIALQIFKYKDGIKSLNVFTNYLPFMSPNHFKAL